MCQRLSIRLDALHRRDTYGRLLTFVIRLPSQKEHTRTHTFVHVLVIYQHTSTRCATLHVATPTIILNIREEIFCDQRSNHEIHKNIEPQTVGAIWYAAQHIHTCRTQEAEK